LVAAVIHWQVALEVTSVVQNPRDLNYRSLAAAVKKKMSWASYQPGGASPFAAETDVVRSDALADFGSLPRAGALRIGRDIAERLFEKSMVRAAARLPNFSSLHFNASRMSCRAAGARMTFSRASDLATIAAGGQFGRGFPPKLIDVFVKLFHRAELYTFASIDLVKTLVGCLAQPVQLGLFFLLALLKQPQAFAHELAGVTVAAGGHLGFNEPVEVFRKVNVPGGHVTSPGVRIAVLAKIAT
jgi:hypothetical protein